MKKAIELIANGAPWAITSEMMDTILAIAERQTDPQAVAAELGRPLENTRTVTERNGISVIPVSGPIFPKANLMTEISGATSIEMLALDFNKALSNPAIHSIVLDIDSPGGNVVGINEFSGMVRDAEKPVIAFVGGMATSAAYWIASAADEVVIEATAQAGNIGVVGRLKLSKDSDSVELISSRAPDKRPDVSTEQGRSVIQEHLDALEDVFLSTVAANRGITVDEIAAHRGRILIGAHAVEAGFADKLGSFESVIAGLSGSQTHRGKFMAVAKQGDDPAPEKLDLTVEKVKADYPDIYHAIYDAGGEAAEAALLAAESDGMEAGAVAERNRIRAVQEQLIPGHEALIEQLKFDGNTTGEQAAVQVLQAEKESRAGNLTDVRDRPAPLPPTHEAGTEIDPNLPLEDRCKQEWEASADLQSEFRSVEAYISYQKAKSKGRVKVLGGAK